MATTTSTSDALPRNYVDLAWRIEVPVASRASAEGYETAREPLFTLKLTTAAAPVAAEANKAGEAAQVAPGAAEDAWLTMDQASLQRVTQSLEEAVDALRSAPYRRMNRLVK